MRETPRKTVIPSFVLTEICHAKDPMAVERSINNAAICEALTYHLKPSTDLITGASFNYNLFPIILTQESAPWDLGMLFILRRLETESDPDMTTIRSVAQDLSAFREWLDNHEDPDELLISFPKMKLRRVTYRYRGDLKKKVDAGEIAISTAKRRMGVVVAFYRWMINEQFFVPDNEPWEEREYKLSIKNSYGKPLSKSVTSTDLSIATPQADDLLDETIQDDGKLRPLPLKQQHWVMDAAYALGNGEMYLFLLFMILTGARIQTVGTLRVRHFKSLRVDYSNDLSGSGKAYRLNAGPGTGIDTKRNKRGVLQIPSALYEALSIYCNSDRARRRRERAIGGDHDDQYLFLTQQGNPYYASKADTQRFDPTITRRHQKNGGTLRQFLKERLIPYVRERYDTKFQFRPHDLRATFGMNQTDIQMELVRAGVITLSKARNNVMALMWHSSAKTTDLYLDYRNQMEIFHAAVNGYGSHVQKWISQGMAGVEN